MKKKLGVATAAAAAAAGMGIGMQPGTARADLGGFWWYESITQGTNSNVVGFWQEVGQLQACHAGTPIDGIFGSKTTQQTQEMVSTFAGYSYSPPVNTEWHDVQVAGSIYGPRLSGDSGWFAAGNYSYYDGAGFYHNELYFEGGGGRWKFRQGSSTNWYWATTARTMGSAAPLC